MSAPYISVVVAARNDDHGGNMLARMQAFLDSWTVQARRYGLDSEIVVVEWNPPASRPRLRDVLQLPPAGDPCSVRFVEVSAQRHEATPNSAAIPLHQMIAKNAGIRRARGEFVLATNLDIVFSPELMEFFAERRLLRGVMYRLDRCDVSSGVPDTSAGVDALIEHCRMHVVRIFAGEGLLAWQDGEPLSVAENDIADPGIQFGRGWYPLEEQGPLRYRWLASEGVVRFERPAAAQLILETEVGPSQDGASLRMEVVDADGTAVADVWLEGHSTVRLQFPESVREGHFQLRVEGRGIPLCPELRMLHLRVRSMRWEDVEAGDGGWRLEVLQSGAGPDWRATMQAPVELGQSHQASYLHINACGDFTLLAREDWDSLRGYPELPIWPVHVDTLICYMANHAGIREEVLRDPLRIYHIEHGSGAGWTPEGEDVLQRRLLALQVPVLDFDRDIVGWVQQMRRWNAPVVFNLENWGLAVEELPES